MESPAPNYTPGSACLGKSRPQKSAGCKNYSVKGKRRGKIQALLEELGRLQGLVKEKDYRKQYVRWQIG